MLPRVRKALVVVVLVVSTLSVVVSVGKSWKAREADPAPRNRDICNLYKKRHPQNKLSWINKVYCTVNFLILLGYKIIHLSYFTIQYIVRAVDPHSFFADPAGFSMRI